MTTVEQHACLACGGAGNVHDEQADDGSVRACTACDEGMVDVATLARQALAMVEACPPAPWHWSCGVSLRTSWGLYRGADEQPVLPFRDASVIDTKKTPDPEPVMELLEQAPYLIAFFASRCLQSESEVE